MPSLPSSTYRLQMTEQFGFAAAAEVVPYLERLGVTDAYCSPLLQAAPGSTHGYDVVDPTRLDPRLGTREEFERFSSALRERGMGLVLDIVPNHMAAHVANPWWHDVLARGEGSRWARHFDIDWSANDGRLLLPVLGAPLEEVIERGELRVEGDELAYWDHRWPLAEGTADPTGDVREVVAAQHYEPADWREQSSRLNYRRFFDITDLVGVRVEDPEVFDDVHRFVLELVRDGHVTGIRVDHVDGLHDPRAYLERLQRELRAAAGTPDESFYVVVEKIIGPTETLPADWPVAGATGYRFLDACDGLFVDAHGAERLQERYAEVAGVSQDFEEVVAEAKLRIVREYFWGELTRLARLVPGVAPDDEEEQRRLRDAIAVVTAQLDVYRTYVDAQQRPPEDDQRIERALAQAAGVEAIDPIALARVAEALRSNVAFTMAWQQFSGPVTAKSVEDTAFYRYHAIPARNEVGAHPSDPAAASGAFHWMAAHRAERWSGSLNCLSTHDTKRSEDVRARLLVLSEEPDAWADRVADWLERFDAPDTNDGWLVAATVAGAWPIDAERLAEYVRKAVREEKLRTSWTDPDEAYEAAIIEFGERLRTSGEVEPIVERLRTRASRNSLAMTAIKLFAPGVPDTYQGTEVQRLALVDPDNRRPVDYDELAALLDAPDAPDKLRLVAAALRARRERRDLYRRGDYLPVRTETRALAFARRDGDEWALLAVPLPGFEPASLGALQLPDGAPTRWTHVVTGAEHEPAAVPLGRLLEAFPVFVAHGRASMP